MAEGSDKVQDYNLADNEEEEPIVVASSPISVKGQKRQGPRFTPSPGYRKSKKNIQKSSVGLLTVAVKKIFVFQVGCYIPQPEVQLKLEQAVGYKVTKTQTFEAVQTLGKIEKETIRVGNQKDGCDNRNRITVFVNISKILKPSAGYNKLWHNIHSSLTQLQPNLSTDILTTIQESIMDNVTPLIEENVALKEKLKFSTKENSTSSMKNRKTTPVKRKLFSASGKTANTDEIYDLTEQISEETCSSKNDQDHLKFNKQALEIELMEFQKICNFGVLDMMKSEDLDLIFGEATFDILATKVRDYCPLLTEVIETIAIGKWSKYNKCKKTVSYKFKTALQMVLALDDIKSQRTTTGFSTLFGLMLISYGAGKVALQALEPFGLCKSYDFYLRFLDKRKERYRDIVATSFPDNCPVILAYDNINIHKGRARHTRLKQRTVPIMWNFTGKIVIQPQIDDVLKDLFNNSKTASEPQKQLKDIKVEDILILENHKELLDIHNEGTDRILLEGLKLGISLNRSKEQLLSMSEKEIMDYLKLEEYKDESNIKISVPIVKPEYPEYSSIKSKVMILPLSLEDEAQTCGTANVLKEFAKDLNIESSKNVEYIVFDKEQKQFGIKAARERYIFYKEMEQHQKDMILLKKQFESRRSFPQAEDSDSDDPQDNLCDAQSGNPASTFKTKMKQISSQMSNLLKKMKLLVADKSLHDAYSAIKLHDSQWIGLVDGYECNLLHMSVGDGNKKLVEALLLAGAPVNTPEGCGITPLMIAINRNDVNLVKILMRYGARCDGTFSGNIPSPLQFAESIEDQTIYNFLTNHLQGKNASINSVFELLEEHVHSCEQLSEQMNTSSMAGDTTTARRSLRDHVITVGDVKTTMTIRGVRNRSPDEFGSFTEAPGDFHTQGYIMQCISRIMGPGGFFHVATQVLNRVKVTPKSFDDIFNHGNFQRNYNTINDFYWGVMIACVKEFQSSDFFPPATVLEEHTNKDGDHSGFMLKCLKDWFDYNRTDSTFEYFYLFLTKFGSLLLKLHQAVRMGNGKARKACWIELTPIFAAFNKKNYKTESLVHIVNFTALWPLAYREMFRRNCSVNAKGKDGHNFAIDEYMETFVVKPVKMYGRKQTTIEMLEKICMNIEILEHVKSVYQKSFEIISGGKSSVPDPTPDWIKVAWFAIHHKWLTNTKRKKVQLYPRSQKNLADLIDIPKECLNVEERGHNKIKSKFKEIIYRQFPTQTFLNFTENTTNND